MKYKIFKSTSIKELEDLINEFRKEFPTWKPCGNVSCICGSWGNNGSVTYIQSLYTD